jgi:hypothetical protein
MDGLRILEFKIYQTYLIYEIPKISMASEF